MRHGREGASGGSILHDPSTPAEDRRSLRVAPSEVEGRRAAGSQRRTIGGLRDRRRTARARRSVAGAPGSRPAFSFRVRSRRTPRWRPAGHASGNAPCAVDARAMARQEPPVHRREALGLADDSRLRRLPVRLARCRPPGHPPTVVPPLHPATVRRRAPHTPTGVWGCPVDGETSAREQPVIGRRPRAANHASSADSGMHNRAPQVQTRPEAL
jgi:hypothetical protein